MWCLKCNPYSTPVPDHRGGEERYAIGVLSDRDLELAHERHLFDLRPWNKEHVQPASVDVTLGNKFAFFAPTTLGWCNEEIDPAIGVEGQMQTVEADEYLLQPQGFVLGVLQQHLTVGHSLVARVEGKSSLGRLGLVVHATAGFVDPGFSGYLTMELFNMSPLPIRLRAGMRIAQLAFLTLSSPCSVPYGEARQSRYADQSEPTPVASRVERKL